MINKIYKRIHSKYWNFFKFFFFPRYVFVIFIIAISLFLLIPKLFDYEKKQEIIKDFLINNYNLEINNYTSTQFDIFPLPNLLIKNADLKVREKPIILKAEKLKIFLNWEKKIGSTRTPIVDGNFIFVVTDNGYFVAMDKKNGKTIWST